MTPEDKLMTAIFGKTTKEKAKEMQDRIDHYKAKED